MDREGKEKWTCRSYLKNNNNKKKNKTKRQTVGREQRAAWEGEEFFFFFLFCSFLSQIYENRTVGIRRIKNESALRDEGYAWVPKKHGISSRIQVKVRKILIFSFLRSTAF